MRMNWTNCFVIDFNQQPTTNQLYFLYRPLQGISLKQIQRRQPSSFLCLTLISKIRLGRRENDEHCIRCLCLALLVSPLNLIFLIGNLINTVRVNAKPNTLSSLNNHI